MLILNNSVYNKMLNLENGWIKTGIVEFNHK